MAFIQIMEMETDRGDEITALGRQFDEKVGDRSTVRRTIVTQDRSNPRRHVVIVFFDSYESAMENSNLPETQEFAAAMQEHIDGGVTFSDLEVIDDDG